MKFTLDTSKDLHGKAGGGNLAPIGLYQGVLMGIAYEEGSPDKEDDGRMIISFKFTRQKIEKAWVELPEPVLHDQIYWEPKPEKAINLVSRIAHIMTAYHSDTIIKSVLGKGAPDYKGFVGLVRNLLKSYKQTTGKSIRTVQIVTKITGRVHNGKKYSGIPAYTNGFLFAVSNPESKKLAFTSTEVQRNAEFEAFTVAAQAGVTDDLSATPPPPITTTSMDDDDFGNAAPVANPAPQVVTPPQTPIGEPPVVVQQPTAQPPVGQPPVVQQPAATPVTPVTPPVTESEAWSMEDDF